MRLLFHACDSILIQLFYFLGIESIQSWWWWSEARTQRQSQEGCSWTGIRGGGRRRRRGGRKWRRRLNSLIIRVLKLLSPPRSLPEPTTHLLVTPLSFFFKICMFWATNFSIMVSPSFERHFFVILMSIFSSRFITDILFCSHRFYHFVFDLD